MQNVRRAAASIGSLAFTAVHAHSRPSASASDASSSPAIAYNAREARDTACDEVEDAKATTTHMGKSSSSGLVEDHNSLSVAGMLSSLEDYVSLADSGNVFSAGEASEALDPVQESSRALFASALKTYPLELQRSVQAEARSLLGDRNLVQELMDSLVGVGTVSAAPKRPLATASKWVVPPSYSCPICLDFMACPFNVSCGHSFCGECLDQLQGCASASTATCPICRDAIAEEDGRYERVLSELIEQYVDGMPESAEKRAWKIRQKAYRSQINSKRLEKLREERGIQFATLAFSVVLIVVVALLFKGRR